ncbi:MAG TPA: aldo/keto reductase [Acholeplasma sp.]|nr:aldo/keto reductase [Acholeplasma sp.]
MKKRMLGKTGFMVSEIALGTWQLGGGWGQSFDNALAKETLCEALKNGINCFDTADVYSNGQSEQAIGKLYDTLTDKPIVITKLGRQLPKQDKSLYTEKSIRGFVNESLERLSVASLDVVLLHCPPSDLYDDGTVFEILDKVKKEGLIKHYGVSVELVEDALKALEYEGVAAIEVIFNMFRLKPLEKLFKLAQEKNVGIIVRVPLASGLLTGKYTKDTTFKKDDHRNFNRDGKAFDKGETFSGVDFDLGLQAVEALKKVFKTEDLVPIALRFCLMFDAVSTVIPGASKPYQVKLNADAAKRNPLTDEEMKKVFKIYDDYIKDSVHHLW